jgi:hypothetical protein
MHAGAGRAGLGRMVNFMKLLTSVVAYLAAILLAPTYLAALTLRFLRLANERTYLDFMRGYQLLMKGKWPPFQRTWSDGGE